MSAVRKGDAVDASISGDRIVFTTVGDLARIVFWRIDDSELASLAAGCARASQGAFGRGGGGWSLLAVHVEEALLSFSGSRGEIRAGPGGRLTVEEQ